MIMIEERRVRHDEVDPEKALALIAGTGLTGHGGAGFPTATKIAAVRGRGADLIINACDGEPLAHKDTVLLRNRPLLLADGIAILQRIVRPRRTMIAVHADGPTESLARAVLGDGRLDGDVLRVPDRYVSSESSALASLARGGDARPFYRETPLTTAGPGRGNRPVLVLNAETVARIAATWLVGGAIATRLLTLAGDVLQPGVVEATLETSIGRLVDEADPVARPRAVLLGGYGGRWFAWDAISHRSVGELGRDVGAGLIMVNGRGCPLRAVGAILGYLADQSAGRCGPCMFGLPAIAADWQLLTDPTQHEAAERRLRGRLPVVDGRGACHHPDGAVRMAASALEVFADDLGAHARGRCVQANVLVGQS